MKKLVLAVAVVFFAAMFVTPVTASEFSAGGTYRAEAVDSDPGGGGESSKYFDQRMRIAFNWKINDNVSTQLRGDFAETAWGDGYRSEAGAQTIMIDRAWAKIVQGPLTLTVGQQYGWFGIMGTLWGDQFQGITAAIDMKPVTLTLIYAKESEGGAGGNALTDDNLNDDTDTYGASVTYGNDAFSGGISYATMQNEATDADTSGLSLHFTVPMGMITILGEFDTFFGDNGMSGTAKSDYEGTQGLLNVSAAVSDALTLGITGIWADDQDGADTQIVSVVDDANFTTLDFDGALGFNNSLNPSCDVFDLGQMNTGVVGLIGDVKFAATDTLTLYGKLGYVEPNEDKNTNLDSAFVGIANFDYAWMPAVTFSGGAYYIAPDYDDNTNDDEEVLLTLQLGVSF